MFTFIAVLGCVVFAGLYIASFVHDIRERLSERTVEKESNRKLYSQWQLDRQVRKADRHAYADGVCDMLAVFEREYERNGDKVVIYNSTGRYIAGVVEDGRFTNMTREAKPAPVSLPAPAPVQELEWDEAMVEPMYDWEPDYADYGA